MNPTAGMTLYTEFEDVAYSPYGVPFARGKENASSDNQFLLTRQQCKERGIDVHYDAKIRSIDVGSHTLTVQGEGVVRYDRLVIATGWEYADPDLDQGGLRGIFEVKDIRRTTEWDTYLDTVKEAVVVECGPITLEIVSALIQRGIKTTVLDPSSSQTPDAVDPDIMAPVRKAWEDAGVTMLCGQVTAFGGDGTLSHVETTSGSIPAQLAIIGTRKVSNNSLARAAGIELGRTGGIVIDSHMRTSARNVFAAGDCVEVQRGVSGIPSPGLSASHAYAQGKAAGLNAAGGNREYQPMYVPWATPTGDWIVGGVAFGETSATASGIKFVSGAAKGITRARYYPGVKPITVKLLADPVTHRLIGAQMVGGEGVKERADFLGVAIRAGVTIEDLATMENVYSPAIGALNEPINLAAQEVMKNF
ncbi:CoA-disulfide reductase [Paraburkholderia hospita]|uniref:CoA-disulfide reductase n=2 Tax=Paraburkholderia hospita TaxID=169430 RepID=A0ABN0F3F7_9BURK|nr:CoA-disulfide reductase [Paraburkholderia hospita]